MLLNSIYYANQVTWQTTSLALSLAEFRAKTLAKRKVELMKAEKISKLIKREVKEKNDPIRAMEGLYYINKKYQHIEIQLL